MELIGSNLTQTIKKIQRNFFTVTHKIFYVFRIFYISSNNLQNNNRKKIILWSQLRQTIKI